MTHRNSFVNGTLTLQIHVDFMISKDAQIPDLEAVAQNLRLAISNWNDGRYGFATEMMDRGLTENLRVAIYECFAKHLQDKYQGEFVDGTARWYIEANKLAAMVSPSVGDWSEVDVSLTPKERP